MLLLLMPIHLSPSGLGFLGICAVNVIQGFERFGQCIQHIFS